MSESPNHIIKTRKNVERKRTHLEFKKRLCMTLIKLTTQSENEPRVKRRRRELNSNIGSEGKGHWPAKGIRGRCRLCLTKKKQHNIVFYCIGCSPDARGHKVHLCIECFQEYHKNK